MYFDGNIENIMNIFILDMKYKESKHSFTKKEKKITCFVDKFTEKKAWRCYVCMFCTLICLYFCSVLKHLALSVNPFDVRSFSTPTPSCKAASILRNTRNTVIVFTKRGKKKEAALKKAQQRAYNHAKS